DCDDHHIHPERRTIMKTKHPKPENGTLSSVSQEPPQVTELAIVANELPPEFKGLADIQRVSFTTEYLDALTVEQETELCKSGLRIKKARRRQKVARANAKVHWTKTRHGDDESYICGLSDITIRALTNEQAKRVVAALRSLNARC